MKKAVIIIVAILVLLGICAGGMKVYHDKQIEKMRNEGIAKVESIVDLNDYREEQQKEINEFVGKATEEINLCEEQEDVDVIIKETSEEILSLKTDAELTKEEEIARKKAEEEARKKAEEEARQKAAAAAAAAKKKSKSKSRGCVGNGSKNFY